jgi:MSHA biogenesis protein MshJ
MKEAFKRYADRIDNASLRERALVFAAAALIVVFLVNATLIQPVRRTQNRLSADIAAKETELRAVQGSVQRMLQARGQDPDAHHRERIAKLRAETQELDAKIAQEQRRFTSPEHMRRVLEEMLQREKGLSIVSLKTLPVSDLTDGQGQQDRRVFRHGVELTLAGKYLDLYDYLRALEGLPTQLFWGRAEMSVSGYPEATLKLTVFTLSFEQAWLVV